MRNSSFLKFVYLPVSTLLLISCSLTKNDDDCNKQRKANSDNSLISIPYLNNCVIDARPDEWQLSYHFQLISNEYFEKRKNNDFKVDVKLAWNEKGILLIAEVTDDSLFLKKNNAWTCDGLEIFVSDSIGSKDLVQYAFVGLPVEKEQDGINVFDYRRSKELRGKPIEYELQRLKTQDGYVIEALLPFQNNFRQGSVPESVCIQIFASDFDKENDTNAIRYKWHYSPKVHSNTQAMYQVYLTESASEEIPDVKAYIIDENELRIRVSQFEDNGFYITDEQGVPLNDITTERTSQQKEQIFIIEDQQIMQHDFVTIKSKDSDFLRKIRIPLLPIRYINIPKPPPFEIVIRNYEQKDKINPPPEGALLFIGSSSIRRWYNLENDMKGIEVINRGFGGSTASDVLRYIHRIVLPYNPSKIIYYEGDNDIARGISPQNFIDSTRKFIQIVRKQLPETKIYLLSVKPCPQRIHIWDTNANANRMLEELAENTQKVYFIDVASAMFDKRGKLKQDIFVADGVHMNDMGYEIWTKLIRQKLKKTSK
jgi:lysophospholipase L1-like esterase